MAESTAGAGWSYAHGLMLALLVAGCTEQLDAGATRPRGLLPVDERNPVIFLNDGAFDNWSGEHALLLANGGGLDLAAIVVSTSPAWPKLEENAIGWTDLVNAARKSGMKNLPPLITSVNSMLKVPMTGKIDDTDRTWSWTAGALQIRDLSKQRALPYRPLVVATGGPLTDVANAYLIDPSVVERVVVISSLGQLDATGATMGIPNGEMDPWADLIVATKFRYIQVSAFYDERADVPESLPSNEFGAWMLAKRPRILSTPVASDQVSLLAAVLPNFVASVQQVSATLPFSADATVGPHLTLDPLGKVQLVNDSVGALASARMWELLWSSSTYSQ